MIVKMTRYGFLLYHRDVDQFLARLGEKGLVDITLSEFTPSDELSKAIERAGHLKRVARELASLKIAATEPFSSVDEAVAAYDEATAKIAQNSAIVARARQEAEQVAVWGDFDPDQIYRLQDAGIRLRFFETTNKAYKPEWEEQYPIEVVHRDANTVHFVVAEKAEEPLVIDIQALEIAPPVNSYVQKESEINRLEAEIEEHRGRVARAALHRQEIIETAEQMSQNIDYEYVKKAGDEGAEGTLKILEGWSPNEDRAAIEEFAASQDVIFTVEDGRMEHNPPIKLKNNFFSRVYEPIGKLYLLPRYDELDMTPFFAPFFMLFFGMCFGDAGYGLLLIVAILVLWKKIPAKFRDFAWLGIFLNLGAVVFGTLTGNVFGIEIFKLQALVPYKEFFLDSNTVFYLSVVIGAIQVLFAQILRIFNRIKRGGSFIYGVSSIGWVLLFISSIVAFTGVADPIYSSSSVAYYITLGVSGFLILFFGKPGKNPFVNFGAGLYNCYEMATGVAGDLISYVRLFAIGVAGTVIAQVFNELSIGMSGDIPVLSIIIMIIILVIGHGLNMFISILGAFVHPVRLTFVEFYKNAEFEGGGREFKPFKRKINNK